MASLFDSRRLVRLGRWLVGALALTLLAINLWGVARFPGYAASNLDSPRFIPSLAWTPAAVQAALAELGWPATTLGWVVLIRDLLIVGVGGTMALLLLRQRAAGWFSLLVALVFALMMGASTPVEVASRAPALARFSATLDAISWQLFFILFYLFPDGRPVPRWTRWLVLGWGAFILAQVLGPDAWRMEPNASISYLLFVLVIAAITSQIYRYLRRSDATQRQQTKLVVFALVTSLVSVFLLSTIELREPDPTRLGASLIVAVTLWISFGLTFALVPAAIDVLIRRTLVYAVVTGVLVAVYPSVVVALQALFAWLTGQTSTLAVVASTLAIAALFGPLRRRVQVFIDRRFFRRKYDARLVLSQFAARAQREADLDALSADLLATVDETLKPEQVRLWLVRR